MNNWQLPEGIDELTGEQAVTFESIRRRLLDLYQSWSYELVVPPMVEYIESLNLTSDSIDQKTFKFLDSSSERMLGVHSDITPQIARIDSKRNELEQINRYCYVNSILQTKSDDFYASRSPIQAGVELYGYEGVDGDIEVIVLMIASLSLLGMNDLTLGVGNTAIFNSLCQSALLNSDDVSSLRDIFRRKSIPDLDDFLENKEIREKDKFQALINLVGDEKVLAEAMKLFQKLPDVQKAINDLKELNNFFKGKDINLMFDLGEEKAYEYHNGIVFAAYHPNFSKALAQGGRYGGLSQAFGSSRAATGFSFDLKFLIRQYVQTTKKNKILNAPNLDDPKLISLINDLRSKGFSIKTDLADSTDVDFIKNHDEWKLKE